MVSLLHENAVLHFILMHIFQACKMLKYSVFMYVEVKGANTSCGDIQILVAVDNLLTVKTCC